MDSLTEIKRRQKDLEVAKEKGDLQKVEFAEWVIGEELDNLEGWLYIETEAFLEGGLKEPPSILDPKAREALAEAYRITGQEIRGREFIEKLKSLQ